MAHFEKYTKAGTWQVLEHDKHTRDGEHIDKERTHLNYNLQPRSDPWQFVKDKIDMSKKSGARFNSRSVALVSCVITLPKEYDGDPRQFFEECKKYLDKLFGADNCVSAWVHLDEPNAQPHLHYKCTPIMRDGDRLQFNAKKLVSWSFLQRFHKDLDKHLTAVFGRSTGVLNGATSQGNQTVEQMKRLTEVKKEVEATRKELDELQTQYDEEVDQYNDLVDQQDILLAKIEKLRAIASRLDKQIEEMKKTICTLEGDDFAPMFDNPDRIGER